MVKRKSHGSIHVWGREGRGMGVYMYGEERVEAWDDICMGKRG